MLFLLDLWFQIQAAKLLFTDTCFEMQYFLLFVYTWPDLAMCSDCCQAAKCVDIPYYVICIFSVSSSLFNCNKNPYSRD